MNRCVNGKLSRSAIHRCLVRHGLSQRPKPDKPAVGTFDQATVGFIHIDLKHLPALQRRKSYAFVAIDRATRYVYLEIHPKRDAVTAQGFLERFLAHFPHPVHTILTDNGSEFTDRFAVDMKGKPHDRPSGRHPFDRVCASHQIDHRLTRPYRPQTNGMVERFNRRLVEAIGRQPKRGIAHRLFVSHADRDAFLNRFVHDYNRTRLKCLGYLAPLQALNNPPGPNTKAGAHSSTRSASRWVPAFALRHAHISNCDAGALLILQRLVPQRPLPRLRGRDRERAGTHESLYSPLPTPLPQAGEGAHRVCRTFQPGDAPSEFIPS